MGYLLASPLRRLYHHPENMLGPYITPGMNILEIGPGMGFFSLPMARLVGAHGRVTCVDLQEKMLRSLERRALKHHLSERIVVHRCSESSLQIENLEGTIDFALAFAVVHEVPNQETLFLEIGRSLRHDGLLLVAEPRGHVTDENFDKTIAIARQKSMVVVDSPNINGSHSSLLKKI